MTAQIGDLYKYNEAEYTCLMMSEGGPFDPRKHGLSPSQIITACWRGFWCEYEIINDCLILQKLHIHDGDNKYPDINGVSITPKDCISGIPAIRFEGEKRVSTEIPKYLGHETYDNLAMAIPYTGAVLLASDYMEEYFVHKGCEWPYGYKKLQSLEFKNGSLIKSNDCSEIAQMVRDNLERDKQPAHAWGEEYIDELPADIRKPVWWLPPPEVREERRKQLEQEIQEWLLDYESKQKE